ncbi:MAG: hypothetical protein LH630_01255 [Actinomycetia bacterium]|nr:hypothetical protein [Actinomycetes bacterium]
MLQEAAVEIDGGEDLVLHPSCRSLGHPDVLAVVVGELDGVEELVGRRDLQVLNGCGASELAGSVVVVEHDEGGRVAKLVVRALGQVRIVGRGVPGEVGPTGVGEVDVEPVVAAVDR